MTEPSAGRSLEGWLAWQATVHPRGIDMGLERIRKVWQRLGSPAPAPMVFSVGGTNGKGSTVAFLEAMLRATGLRVGTFTSPHLLRYNERVHIDGLDADDASLVQAFEQIEKARGDVSLTYFEFAALAAILLFAQCEVDVAVLEVGLGGRLDAVNLIDADVAIVTTVDIDHQEWLGNDKESIAREKAGIFRPRRPAIIGENDPPRSLLDVAMELGSIVQRSGHEFTAETTSSGWRWSNGREILELPLPAMDAPCQMGNAAAAIAALHALRDRIAWQPSAIAAGVANAKIGGRLQRLADEPDLIVDVAHNPQAARELAAWIEANPIPGRNIAVFGALDDKDVDGMLAPLLAHVHEWHLCALNGASPRGLSLDELEKRLMGRVQPKVGSRHEDVASALGAALQAARHEDRVLAFGSFFVVAGVLAAYEANSRPKQSRASPSG